MILFILTILELHISTQGHPCSRNTSTDLYHDHTARCIVHKGERYTYICNDEKYRWYCIKENPVLIKGAKCNHKVCDWIYHQPDALDNCAFKSSYSQNRIIGNKLPHIDHDTCPKGMWLAGWKCA